MHTHRDLYGWQNANVRLGWMLFYFYCLRGNKVFPCLANWNHKIFLPFRFVSLFLCSCSWIFSTWQNDFDGILLILSTLIIFRCRSENSQNACAWIHAMEKASYSKTQRKPEKATSFHSTRWAFVAVQWTSSKARFSLDDGIFLFTNEMILVSLCKTMQIHFAPYTVDRQPQRRMRERETGHRWHSVRRYNIVYYDWQCQTKT